MRALQKLIHGSYSRLLDRALNFPKATLAIAAVIFVASLQLFGVIGFGLFPASAYTPYAVTPLRRIGPW